MRTHLWKYAAATAACAVVAAVPVAASQDRQHKGPARVAPVSAEPEPGPGVTPDLPRGRGAGWPVADRMVADADGDGVGDTVVLRQKPGVTTVGPARLEVQLSSTGANVFTIVPLQPVGFTLAGSRAAAGGPAELLLHLQPTSGDRRRLAVFVVDGERLRRAGRAGAE